MRRVTMSIELTDDIWWIFDRYILSINAKLRQRGAKEVAGASILGAIIAKFLIENQRSILDEYNKASAERVRYILPRLGFADSELSAVGLSADTGTASDCATGTADAAQQKSAGALRTDAPKECPSARRDARSKPTGRPSTCIRATRRIAGGSKTVRGFVP